MKTLRALAVSVLALVLVRLCAAETIPRPEFPQPQFQFIPPGREVPKEAWAYSGVEKTSEPAPEAEST